jgi:hypothetical protein
VSVKQFRKDVWEKELGKGGLIGDLTDLDRGPIGLMATAEMRRFIPVWENARYLPPCQAGCPTGIPVQQRWAHIRNGEADKAVDLSLLYTPFPPPYAAICVRTCAWRAVRALRTAWSPSIRRFSARQA